MNKLIALGVIIAALGCGGGKGNNNGGTAGASGTTGAAGSMGAAGSTGAGGSGSCVMGREGCACYGNDTCDANLQCLSQIGRASCRERV